jgi:hypothetical protein
MKSASEEFCKDGFDKFLKNLLPDSVISWDEVAKKDEPPEFYLFIDAKKYAVEVTTLMQKVSVGAKKPLPLGTVRDLLRKFVVDEVESVARDNNYLHGAYLVTFSKPIDSFANPKNIIQGELLTYIRATQNLSNAPGKVIYKCGRQKCEIEKTHDRDNKVVMGGPIISKWEGEILADVDQLLDKSIGLKEYKLKNISCPKVLLLHDKYHYADAETHKACISSIFSLGSFHTVFIVENTSKGSVLHSQNPKWMSNLIVKRG